MPDVVALSDSFVASLPKGWNATVRIKQANGTTDATVYKDANGDATGANPLPLATADFGRNYDGNGGWQCYLVPGDYVVSVTPHGGSEHHTSVTVTAAAAKVVRAVYEVYGTPAAGQVPTWSDDDGHLEWADPTGGGGGGGASEHLGDYGKWAHAGPTDGDSGTFDYAADLVDTSGTTISTDDSSEWIDNWGYPTAQVTESGTYSLFVGCSSSDAFSVAVYLLNAQGQGTSPTPFEDVASLLAVGAQVSGAGQYTASQSLTAYLPAGTHIDVSLNADGDPNPLSLLIQRVA